METLFLISWIIAILYSIYFTALTFITKPLDKKSIGKIIYFWIVSVLCGWIMGIVYLAVTFYMLFDRE
jgi:hypothetical protein